MKVWIPVLLRLVFSFNFTSPSVEAYYRYLTYQSSPLTPAAAYTYTPDQGVSIAVTSLIKRTDCVVNSPISWVITSADEFALTPGLEGFDPFSKMVLRMAFERFSDAAAASATRDYIRALPSEFNQPLIWTDADFILLEEHSLEDVTRDDLRKYDVTTLLQRYTQVQTSHTDLPLDRDSLLWAVLTTASRAFLVTSELRESLQNPKLTETDFIFAPFLDTVNHFPFKPSKKKTNLSFFTRNNTNYESVLCLRAVRMQFPGAYFYGFYGEISNFELLSRYGFTMEFNPEDIYRVRVPMHEKYCLGEESGEYCLYSIRAGNVELKLIKHLIAAETGIMFKDEYKIRDISQYIGGMKNSFAKKKTGMSAVLTYRNIIQSQLMGTGLRTLRRMIPSERENRRNTLIISYAISQRAGRYAHIQKVERELLRLYGAGVI